MSSDSQQTVPPPFRQWPEGAEIKTFKSRCHCGKITFEFDHPALEVHNPVSCNCSLCTRTGGLYIYGPESALRITGDEPMGFISKSGRVHHRFCPGCGNTVYWTGMGRAGANVRLFDEVEIDKLQINTFDGRRLL